MAKDELRHLGITIPSAPATESGDSAETPETDTGEVKADKKGDSKKTKVKAVKKRRRFTTYSIILHLLAWPVIVITGLGFAGAMDWRLDLMSHFRLQYAGYLLLIFVLAWLAKRWVLGIVLTGALVTNLWLVLPAWLGSDDMPVKDHQTLTVMQANVLTSNTRVAEVMSLIENSGADVVVLQEVDRRWMQAIEKLESYQVVIAQPRRDNFGMAILRARDASWGMQGQQIWLGPDKLPAFTLRLTHRNPEVGSWRLLAAHPLPPVSKDNTESRDESLKEITAWVKAQIDDPILVVGDLNATPWSYPFRKMVRETGLVDSRIGHGNQPTWPNAGGLGVAAMIPIDHVLHSDDLVTVERRTIARNGSDHRFVLAQIKRCLETP